jgi:hypothetical protein
LFKRSIKEGEVIDTLSREGKATINSIKATIKVTRLTGTEDLSTERPEKW